MEEGTRPGAIDCFTAFGFFPERGLGLSTEGLIELMGRAGIDRALTLSATGIYVNHEKGNAETLAACSEHPELIPVATVDPRYLVVPAQEVVAGLKESFAALRVFPDLQSWTADMLPFVDLAKAAAEVGLPLIAGLGRVGDATHLARAAADLSALPLVASCRRMELIGELLAVARELPNLCLETSGLLGLNSVSLAAARIGVERLLFGSNAPLYCPVCELENLAVSDFSDPDREKVLRANAARIFGLDLEKP